jgi:hypothetical protein
MEYSRLVIISRASLYHENNPLCLADRYPPGPKYLFERQSILAHLTIEGFGKIDEHMFYYRKLATLDDRTPALVPESTQPKDIVPMLMRRYIPLILRSIEVQDLSIEENIETRIRKVVITPEKRRAFSILTLWESASSRVICMGRHMKCTKLSSCANLQS